MISHSIALPSQLSHLLVTGMGDVEELLAGYLVVAALDLLEDTCDV